MLHGGVPPGITVFTACLARDEWGQSKKVFLNSQLYTFYSNLCLKLCMYNFLDEN